MASCRSLCGRRGPTPRVGASYDNEWSEDENERGEEKGLNKNGAREKVRKAEREKQWGVSTKRREKREYLILDNRVLYSILKEYKSQRTGLVFLSETLHRDDGSGATQDGV